MSILGVILDGWDHADHADEVSLDDTDLDGGGGGGADDDDADDGRGESLTVVTNLAPVLITSSKHHCAGDNEYAEWCRDCYVAMIRLTIRTVRFLASRC